MADEQSLAETFGTNAALTRSPLAGAVTIGGSVVLGTWLWVDVFFRTVVALPGTPGYVVYHLLLVVGAVGTLVGVVGAYTRYREYWTGTGRIAKGGAVVAGIGLVVVCLGALLEAAYTGPADATRVGGQVLLGGYAVTLVGCFGVASGSRLVGVPDRLVSGLLIIALPTFLLEAGLSAILSPEITGGSDGFGLFAVPLGLAWAIVGRDIRAGRVVTVEDE